MSRDLTSIARDIADSVETFNSLKDLWVKKEIDADIAETVATAAADNVASGDDLGARSSWIKAQVEAKILRASAKLTEAYMLKKVTEIAQQELQLALLKHSSNLVCY